MAATAKSKFRQSASEMFDVASCGQEQLQATLSPEKLLEVRRRNWEEFNRLCDEASRQARANGLTEEILSEILADE
jgi:hypothetical protein